jgi:hypothetical protein
MTSDAAVEALAASIAVPRARVGTFPSFHVEPPVAVAYDDDRKKTDVDAVLRARSLFDIAARRLA